ncbi:zinc finger protein 143-like isoform X2 [Argopecten irradians]|uniref:zinc finger protein 143-like isoform X2 n=1 Tax=Argopecten irradians TaxID=31199 RepID=UPI003717CB67
MALTGSDTFRILTSTMVTDQSTNLDHTLRDTQTCTTRTIPRFSEPGMGYQPQGPGVVQVHRSDTAGVMPTSTYIYLSNKDKFDTTQKLDTIQQDSGATLNDVISLGQEASPDYSNNRSTPVMLFLNQDQNPSSSAMETNLMLHHHPLISDMYNIQNNLTSIYAIAQANLVAQTQQDIAKQLIGQTEDQGHDEVNLAQMDNTTQQSSLAPIPGEETATNNRMLVHTSSSQPQNEIKHPENTKEKEEKIFVCKLEKCGRNFASAGHLRNHQTNHSRDKPLTCTHEGCGRTFTWPAHLKYHKLTHMSTRNFACDMCDKKFYTAQRLKVHARIHTGEKPFKCDECEKEFTTAGNLKNHKRIHSGERPYACSKENCEKRFAEYSSLRKHMLTHTGEKPFKCDECGRSFTQSGSRTIHMKKHLLAEEMEDEEEEEVGRIDEKNCEPTIKSGDQNVVVLHNGQEDLLQYQDVFQTSDTTAGVGNMTAESMTGHGSANVVVVAQPPMMVSMDTDFHNPHGREEIVYDSEFLHSDLVNEEIAHNITDTINTPVTMEMSNQSKPTCNTG